jgi:hypothetical protein
MNQPLKTPASLDNPPAASTLTLCHDWRDLIIDLVALGGLGWIIGDLIQVMGPIVGTSVSIGLLSGGLLWLSRGGPTARRVSAHLRGAVPVTPTEVSINLVILSVTGSFSATNAIARQLAWDLHVELATRIATQDLAPGSGLIKSALSSLHGLYGYTRGRLHEVGSPPIRQSGADTKSVHELAIALLNGGLRTFLATWHPLIPTPNPTIDDPGQQYAAEVTWNRAEECREKLKELQNELRRLSEQLRQLALEP